VSRKNIQKISEGLEVVVYILRYKTEAFRVNAAVERTKMERLPENLIIEYTKTSPTTTTCEQLYDYRYCFFEKLRGRALGAFADVLTHFPGQLLVRHIAGVDLPKLWNDERIAG
jgi:hypothetical protein